MATGGSVLVSGASIAGPTLAYWLSRHGFTPTVVERTPELRRGLGGHAVDLFGPSYDVAQRMGVLPAVLAARTTTQVLTLEHPGRRPVDVDLRRLMTAISKRHVEILRGELAAILYEASRAGTEYVFGDSIRTIEDMDSGGGEVAVTFEHGPPRRFDLVVGADGLHSNVRLLTFGDESQFRRWLGGYLCVFTLPGEEPFGRMRAYTAVDKLVSVYPTQTTGSAKAVFFFRRAEELVYDHHDIEHQKQLLRDAFAGEGWEVPRLLAELDHATDFYFDSISQIHLESWSRGRVTLVGDAGYCPGPAVGGGTTLAVVGAYVLAGELAAAGGDPTAGFRNYEKEMAEFVRRTRTIGPSVMKTLMPRSELHLRFMRRMTGLMPRLPVPVQRALWSLQGGAAQALTSITLKDYGADRPPILNV
jgi:2-polyprenyl-6-methoxyphenol hydroxylase-like FAD-dependent oxidoreductase